jgi:hypothetical protein
MVTARVVMATSFALGASAILSASDSEPCHARGSHEISITCDYTSDSSKDKPAAGEPRIALNHAAFSFKTKHDNWMSIALTFTNLDSAKPSEARPVYLAIDDDSGKNYIRRVLPHVDFRTLAPGQKSDFSEHLLIPALHSGHYRIELWIPSSNSALKFDVAHNLLIESVGVADRKTGLNRVASFSVIH